MKVKEFIKMYGWGDANALVDASKLCGIDKKYVDIVELKKYVDAYELVNSCGGLKEAKEWLQKDIQDEYWDDDSVARKRAITLVEEVEVGEL